MDLCAFCLASVFQRIYLLHGRVPCGAGCKSPLRASCMCFLTHSLLQGIYPTLIIILVALDKSQIDKHSLAEGEVTPFSAIRLSPLQVANDTETTLISDQSSDSSLLRPLGVLLKSPLPENNSHAGSSRHVWEDRRSSKASNLA